MIKVITNEKFSMRRICTPIYLLSAFIFFLTGCASLRQPKKTVTILAVNDIHASIDRFPRFAYMVDSLRLLYPDLLLVSGGDNQTGNPINDSYDPKGWPVIDLMNDLKFTTSTVGNHEFDSGIEGFEYLSNHTAFPYICANINKQQGSKLNVKPYYIHTLPSGVKVAFIGLVEVSPTTKIPASHPKNVACYTFTDPVVRAQEYVHLKDSADLTLFLTHLGFEEDQRLAESLNARDIPLIIGGHTHLLVPDGTYHNGVLITQAESHLKYATLIQVDVSTKGKPIISEKTMVITKVGSENKAVADKVRKYSDNPTLKEVIAVNTERLDNKEQLGYFLTDALRSKTGTEMALLNGGGIRLPSWDKGNIEVQDVYSVDPFGNKAVLFEMTPEEIRKLIMAHVQDDKYRLCFGSGLNIHYLGADVEHITGVEIYDSFWRPLKEGKRYTVSMNNYLSQTYMPKDKKGEPLDTTTADLVVQYLRETKCIPSYHNEKRIKVGAN